MRTIHKDSCPPDILENDFHNLTVANPAYMKIGDEICCNAFPGENVGDPGYDHAMILTKISADTFKISEVRLEGYRDRVS